jgi:hypothetical protein
MRARKSSSHKRVRAALAMFSVAGLCGCTDYVKHSDTVTFTAGGAQAWNKTVHISDPWPPYVMDTRITGDGQRVARVMRTYSNGQDSNAAAGAQPQAGQTAPQGAQP